VLVDREGKVIGVTTAIISPVQASAGVGFAIPSAIVAKVVPALIETGHYEHPWLGISGVSLSPELAKAMGLEPNQRGALVVDVVPDSPADKAGLRGSDRQVTIEGEQVRVGGDVIIGIDGHPVRKFDDVITYLARATSIGQTITLSLLREGKEKEVKVTLGARPESATQSPSTEVKAESAWLGILGMTLTAEVAQAMGLAPDQEGVLVQQVQRDSPADRAGLRGSYKPVYIEGHRLLVGGDVIIALEGEPIRSVEELKSELQRFAPGETVTLTILRDGKQTEISVTLGTKPS
jgi:S1-C subfamily serine protease